jgi:hypothetical protein
VLVIEDIAGAGSDLDYNDIVFSISDGTNVVSNLEHPNFEIGVDESDKLQITETQP